MASFSMSGKEHAIPSTLDPAALRASYERDGYVVIPAGVLLDAEQMAALRSAAKDVTNLTRCGQWDFRRVVGKQFPPFDAPSQDSWGVQHLLHPSLPHSPLFTSFYASAPLLDISAHLLNSTPDALQLELFNLLIHPQSHAFALGWHRDDIRADVDAETERRRLEAPCRGVQWNVALEDDACLFVIPETHRRCRSDAEVRANRTAPPEARLVSEKQQSDTHGEDVGFDGSWDIDPPNTLRVALKAGEGVFYSQRILHRASYLPSRTRYTLHGCYGAVSPAQKAARSKNTSASSPAHPAQAADPEDLAIQERARMVLQHGVEWMRDPSFRTRLPERLQPMWDNLIANELRWNADEVGYSQDEKSEAQPAQTQVTSLLP